MILTIYFFKIQNLKKWYEATKELDNENTLIVSLECQHASILNLILNI